MEDELRKYHEVFTMCWKLFKGNVPTFDTVEEVDAYCDKVIRESDATYQALIESGHDRDVSKQMVVAVECALNNLCRKRRERIEAEHGDEGVQMGFYDMVRETA